MMSILNRLQPIFRDIFDDETLILKRETSAVDIEDWDSLAQVNIVVACESEFGVKFSLSDFSSIKNVGDFVDLIEKKIN
ncbi:MAG: acyl carrier protein [Synergistaceae bacterium]|nr:acyl carrier protein [Synergistaceae bacterium]